MFEITFNPLQLTAMTSHAEIVAKYGIPFTRNAWTLKKTRKEFKLDEFAELAGLPKPTNWKKAAVVLRELKKAIDSGERIA